MKVAETIDGPIALKIQSRDIPHKSDVGGVKLGLTRNEEIKKAYKEILANVQNSAPDAVIDGVLVRPMAREGVEMILGIKYDNAFGPMVLLGLGGIFVEVLQDVLLLPTPFSKQEALTSLDRLKGAAVLSGVRET